MSQTRFFVGIGALLLSLAGCSGGDGSGNGNTPQNRERVCDVSCEKFAECGLLIGGSVETCKSDCKMDAQTDDGSCNPTQSEVNTCISAFEAADCTALAMNGVPECELCEDDDGGSMGMDAGPGPSPDVCNELAACCPNIQDAQAREACENTVASGSNCGPILAGYQQAGFCPAS